MSGDDVSLYPSLNINICANEVGRYFGKSGLKVENLLVEGAIKLVKAVATKEIESAGLDKIM